MTHEAQTIFKVEDKVARTFDGFENFAARLGVVARGEEGGRGTNIISEGNYILNLVTRNRVLLEAAYRGSWIVGRVIDSVAEDMTKAGVILNTNDEAEKIQEFEVQLSRLQIWQSICDGIKWGRLYGGALAVVQIDGQDPATPLDLDTVGEGQFKGLVIYDRWQVYPVLSKLIESGPNMGLPAYYDIVLGSNLNDPGREPGGQITSNPNSHVRVHHSRCARFGGIKLPFFQAITEMMWDESVLERLWDRLVEFDTATSSAGSLILRANLRTVGVKGLREILAAGGKAQEGLIAQFEMMRQLQTNEGITLLDEEDNFQSTAYSFAGLSDMLIQFGQQLSGSCEVPMVRLFGQSPAGMNSTGENDMRMYYDSINAKQEAHLRNPVEMILKVLWRSFFGEPAPMDLSFDFTPLWQISEKEKADIAKTNTDTISEAHQEGLVDTQTAMKELKQMSGDCGIFTHITDEQIEEAENEEPPSPELTGPGGGTTGDPGEGPKSPLEKPQPKPQNKANDSIWVKVKHWAWDAVKSPVNDPGVAGTMKEFYAGTLKSSSGQKVTSKKQALAIGYSEEGEDAGPTMASDHQKIKDWLAKQ